MESPEQEDIGNLIETIPQPDQDAVDETEIISSFYQKPEEYETSSLSEEVDYKLTGMLQESFSKLGITKGKVLDIGCGSGLAADALRGLPGCEFAFTGVDIAKPMLEFVIANKGYSNGLFGRSEDVTSKLVEQRRSFDISISLTSLYYVKDPLPVIDRLLQLSQHAISVSFDEMTEEYISVIRAATGKVVPLYNHVGILDDYELPMGWSIGDNLYGPAWNSPRVGTAINAQLVTLIKQ